MKIERLLNPCDTIGGLKEALLLMTNPLFSFCMSIIVGNFSRKRFCLQNKNMQKEKRELSKDTVLDFFIDRFSRKEKENWGKRKTIIYFLWGKNSSEKIFRKKLFRKNIQIKIFRKKYYYLGQMTYFVGLQN